VSDRSGIMPQLLGAAVGIVLGSVLLFALLGMLRDDSPDVEVVAEPTTAEQPTGDATSPDAAPDDEAPAEPTATEEPAQQPTEEPTEDASAPEPPAEEVDPASVSIQVLDAVGDGSSARAVADELREAGYDVVVINRAGREYDVTTVFWSPEQDAAGQQVAAAIGAGQAEPTPEEVRLSDSVDVHVVVGADRT
jgi:hypothetical protein